MYFPKVGEQKEIRRSGRRCVDTGKRERVRHAAEMGRSENEVRRSRTPTRTDTPVLLVTFP